MIHDKKEFAIGAGLLAGFFIVLGLLFMPWLEGGRNTIEYLDNVFNSISKHSAYFIPGLRDKVGVPSAVKLELRAKDTAQAQRMQRLLSHAGMQVSVQDTRIAFSGDLARLLGKALDDADLMFANRGEALQARYGEDGRRMLYAWHRLLGAVAKALDGQDRFAESKLVRDVLTKGVEPAYNYYGVQAVPMRDLLWVVFAALVGYVLYTVWYGYAILYLFEGWGLRLEH